MQRKDRVNLLPRYLPNNCCFEPFHYIGFIFYIVNWFDEQITCQIREHFDRILHGDIEGKRPHIRGLTYVLHGRDIILISDYIKSLKRKCVNNNFVLQFNLDRAFSTNEKLLATVTYGSSSPSLARPRPFVSGSLCASFGFNSMNPCYLVST